MKTILVCLFALIFISSCTAEEEAVITLTTENFNEIALGAEFIAVEFYAPWCGHCKHLAPEWEKAAQTLKTRSPPILLAKVDATVESELGSRYEVQGYPTIKLFRNGNPTEYNGPRDAAGIISYLEKQAGPASKVLTSAAEIAEFKKRADAVVVAFFAKSSLDTYHNIANGRREDYLFAEVTDSALVASSGHAEKIVVFRSDDKELEAPADIASLEGFLKSNTIPIAGTINADNAKRYAAVGLPILKLFIDVDFGTNAKRTLYYKRRLAKVGEEFEGKIIVALADKSSLGDASSIGITGIVPEAVAMIEDTASRKFPYTGQFSVEGLRQFVVDFTTGKLKAHMKSEPIPENNNGPVKVVVGENFDEIVMDPRKNVFIEFYAPWCGHCKTLAPKWDELGAKLADDTDVVIAKMDATANDWPKDKFEVSGFPTLYFKTAGKTGVTHKYAGPREVKDMKKWVKQMRVDPAQVLRKDEL